MASVNATSSGPVHFRLDDIDRTRAGIAGAGRIALQIMDGDQRRDHGVEQPLGRLVSVSVVDGGVGHQMPDIAHQHERAPMQREGGAIRCRVAAIRIEASGEARAAL